MTVAKWLMVDSTLLKSRVLKRFKQESEYSHVAVTEVPTSRSLTSGREV